MVCPNEEIEALVYLDKLGLADGGIMNVAEAAKSICGVELATTQGYSEAHSFLFWIYLLMLLSVGYAMVKHSQPLATLSNQFALK